MLAAIKCDAEALAHASDKLRASPDLVLRGSYQNGLTLRFASSALRADREIVMAAIEQDLGTAFEFASQAISVETEALCWRRSNRLGKRCSVPRMR